jgi:hypothetical protein
MTLNKEDTNSNDSSVDISRPPMTDIAMGDLNSPPVPKPSALGNIPATIAMVVMMIGRALVPGFENGLVLVHTKFHPLYRKFDQHDGVLGDNSHQHKKADDDRQADRHVKQIKCQDGTTDTQRQRQQNRNRGHEAVEQDHQDDVNQQNTKSHRERERRENLGHDFGIATSQNSRAHRHITRGVGGINRRQRRPEHYTVSEIRFYRGAIEAIITFDLAGTIGKADVGHDTEWDSFPARARNTLPGHFHQVMPDILAHPHDDRNLSTAVVKLGEAFVAIANGRDALK